MGMILFPILPPKLLRETATIGRCQRMVVANLRLGIYSYVEGVPPFSLSWTNRNLPVQGIEAVPVPNCRCILF